MTTPKPRTGLGKPMQFGKKPGAKAKAKRSPRYGGEPHTVEGRARKKIQMGMKAGFGCVLTHQEMLLVAKELPPGWLKKECL